MSFFSTILFETFYILRSGPDVIKNLYQTSRKEPLIIVGF